MFTKLFKGGPDKTFVKSFLKIAVPIILSEMLMIAVGFIDNFMIGNYGNHEISLGSVAIANEILFLGMGMPMFFMTTFTIFLAQYAGKKDEEKMRQTVKFWISTALVFSILFAIITSSVADSFVNLFIKDKSDPNTAEIVSNATNYVRYAMPSVVMMCPGFIAMTSAAITGRPHWTLILGIGSIAINIVGDYLLIYTADMGVDGSAIATDIARVYEISLAVYVLRRFDDINVFKNFWHYDWKLYKKEIKKVTTAISQLAFTLSLVGLSLILTRGYGNTAAAALAPGYAVAGILWSVFPGIGTGVKVFIGKNLGSGEHEVAQKNVKNIALTLPIIIFTLSAAAIIFAFALLGVMGVSGEARTMARNMILIYAVAIFFYSYSSMYFNVLSAGGHVRASNIVQNYFQLFIIIPIAAICIWAAHLSFTETFIVSQSLQVIPFVVAVFLEKRGKWKNNLTHADA